MVNLNCLRKNIYFGWSIMLECALLLGMWVCLSDPADAQWQVPDHAIPIGNGAGVTGFANAAPGTAGYPLASNGISSDPSFQQLPTAGIADNAVTLAKLATQATNTILGNATAGSAVPTALAIGSCDTATKALQWTTNTGFGCNSAIEAAALSASAFANPSTSIGLTANNGVATTAMRSDATPALSQAIAPTWTGLHSFTTTAGGISMSGNPNISQPFSGQTDLFGFYSNLTAASETTAEVAAYLGITSSIGATNALVAYKMGLAMAVTVNSGSAYGWGINPVINIGNGGAKRGGIGVEININNAWGNYTGSPSSPYVSAFYATGTNTAGGYGSCALCIEYGGTGALWQAGVHAGPANSPQFNTAFLWDESDSPTVLKVTGTHTIGIDLSGATLTTPFQSPFFAITNTGGLSVVGTSSGTVTVAAQAAAGTPTLFWPTGSGTLASSATSPLSLSATTGALSCSTCVTTAGGQTIAGITSSSTVQAATGNTNGYYIAGNAILQQIGDYSYLFTSNGTGALQLGNNIAPVNYFNNATHSFRDVATTTTFVSIDSTGATFNQNIYAPNLATTTAALAAALCWTATTGEFQRDTNAGGCLVSAREAKNIHGPLLPEAALNIVMKMKPEVFHYKNGYGDSGKFEQIGFIADEVAQADERFAIRNDEGKLTGVRYMQTTAALAGAIQYLKADNDKLRREFKRLKRRTSR